MLAEHNDPLLGEDVMKSILQFTFLVAALVLVSGPVQAGSFGWTGLTPDGEDESQFPSGVSGEVSWSISGDIVTFVLENTTAGALPNSGWVLSGMAFNAGGFMLTAQTATAENLLFWDGDSWEDSPLSNSVEDFWAFKAGISAYGTMFDYALGAVGDIDNGSDSLGVVDIIGTGLGGQPDGIDYAIVGNSDPGFSPPPASNSPVIQNFITVTFAGATGMTMDDITDVTPYFGTDGASGASVPEPTTMVLFGAGLLAAGIARRRKRKTA